MDRAPACVLVVPSLGVRLCCDFSQAALDDASMVRGVQIINISLRMLHVDKQPAWQRPLVAALQSGLRETPLGAWFFSQIANPKVGAGLALPRRCWTSARLPVCWLALCWMLGWRCEARTDQAPCHLPTRLPAPAPAALPGHISVATAQGVKSVLQQCYGDPSTVDDELVDLVLKPGELKGGLAGQ